MHFEKLTNELEKFGFTKAQAKLYLAGVRLKQTLMARLAKAAGIKRTTAYYMMEELERRGYFQHKKIGKRTYYIAATPKRLLEMTKEREGLVKILLPALKSLVTSPSRPLLIFPSGRGRKNGN